MDNTIAYIVMGVLICTIFAVLISYFKTSIGKDKE